MKTNIGCTKQDVFWYLFGFGQIVGGIVAMVYNIVVLGIPLIVWGVFTCLVACTPNKE